MSDAVHVGVSDNYFTHLDETNQTGMARCQIIKPPVLTDVEINAGCRSGIYGQYIYISLIRTSSEAGFFQINEVGVYMGEHINRYIISYRIASNNTKSYHVMSRHVTSHHISYIVSYRIIYHILSYHTIPYHISHHITSYHIKSNHISHHISHIISYRIVSHRTVRYHIISYYIISYKNGS